MTLGRTFVRSLSVICLMTSRTITGKNTVNARHLRTESRASQKHGRHDALRTISGSSSDQAMDLPYFQNLNDSTDKFSWVNVTEIQAGSITCGFLKPNLGYMPGHAYPSIEVYFCMRFANRQPAVNGNLAVHCGGPGSLSTCTPFLQGSYLTQDILDTYNIISFDQRGMGRSWPSFSHEECTYGIKRNENGTIIEMLGAQALNPSNETSVEAMLEQQKQRLLTCWSCSSCDFTLNATDGSEKYHFLDFSGSQEVVQDLDLFRQVIGAKRLSLLGISYGTQIMSNYATLFPDQVDKFILDSTMSPSPDLLAMATASASNSDARLDYLVFSCTARNAVHPGSCPVADLGECFNNVTNLVTSMYDDNDLNDEGFSLANTVLFLAYDDETAWDGLKTLCEAGAEQNRTTVLQVVEGFREAMEMIQGGKFNGTVVPRNETDDAFDENEEASHDGGDDDEDEGSTDGDNEEADALAALRPYLEPNESGPTFEYAVYNNPDYAWIMNSVAAVPQTMVLGQSMSNGCHDSDYFKVQVKEIDRLYSGYNTHDPALQFMAWYAMGFYWPKPHPIPPAGHPLVKGIISGQMYDSATPYIWSQEMKMAFPQTKLLTSQWISHGMDQHKNSVGENPCLEHIVSYLKTGKIDAPDGAVCRSGFPGPNDFSFI